MTVSESNAMTPEEYRERAERFQNLRKTKPGPGDILKVKAEGGKAPVIVQTNDDETNGKYRMFCNAAIDDEATGWFLTSEGIGLKCLILPRSQDYLIGLNGGSTENLEVDQLRVVRESNQGTSLICEVVLCE